MRDNSFTAYLRIALQLGKWHIALPITLSALTGYVVRSGRFDAGLAYTFLGVGLLACGSMALNQIQERRLDALMERTAWRPLPSGRISIAGAIIVSMVYLLAGSFFLWWQFPLTALLFGWLTVIWYNLVYTPLKRVSAFAALPGSVVGALPPVIGWLAAGGAPADHRIVLIAFFFFFGQIPHFWMLLMIHGHEYKAAGLPSITALFNEKQIRRLSFVWIFWSAVISLFLAMFGVMTNRIPQLLLLAGALAVILLFIPLIVSPKEKFNFKRGFLRLNIFYLYVMCLLCLDSFI